MYQISNGTYTMHIGPAGTGYSSWRDIALSRWTDDPVEDNAGFFIYLRDLANGERWSLGHQPLRQTAERYRVHGTKGRFLLERHDRGIESRLMATVVPTADVEIRRITLRNDSDHPRRLEVTGYLEVVLASAAADAAHPAFAKLFVETEAIPEQAILLATRRPRGATERRIWMGHRLVGIGTLQYTTERSGFVGRNRSLASPRALTGNTSLAGVVGPVLEPIFSLRRVVDLQPGAEIELSFLLAAANTRDTTLSLLNRYGNASAIAGVLGRLNTVQEIPWDIPFRAAAEQDAPSYSPAPHVDEYGLARDEPLRYANGLGGFSEDGLEYVIQVRAGATGQSYWPPKPWINVIANEKLGFLISESGAGYTWSRNSREHRLTPWYNDPLLDPHGEALYIRDEDAKSYWSPLPGPLPQAAHYTVRHGLGYTRFRHVRQDLEHDTTLFVARDEPLKIARLRLTNRTGQARRLSLFGYYRLVLGVLPEDAAPIETHWDESAQALLARNPSAGVFNDGIAFAAAIVPQGGTVHYSGDRLAFLGHYGNPAEPAAVRTVETLDGRTGQGLQPCAALQMTVTLEPNATSNCAFVLGELSDEAAIRTLLHRYRQPGALEAALLEVQAFWWETAAAVQIKTPAPAIDLMVNTWLIYQNLSCRLWGRSAAYQSGGAFGFRDQLQDAAALVYSRPDLTRQQILLHAAHQFDTGDVFHWWHPAPIARGLRTRFSDDLLWLPYVTAFYLQVTGDAGILEETVPFVTARELDAGEDEAYLPIWETGKTATLYEHCCRALDRSLTKGKHGLPLMGSGDWNDGMNRVGREGRGESVWLGFFIYAVLNDFIPLCKKRGDKGRAQRYRNYRRRLQNALNEGGWDGAWYRRAYYDDGTPLGSAQSDECRIDALAQAWAVISGAAPAERAVQAMNVVERELIDASEGLVRLLAPPFDKTPKDPGYIKGYVPGVRENGGQYTHAALWVVRALAELGRNNRAAAVLEMLSPISHAATPEQVACYQVEPYVIAADIYGVEPHRGKGGWTWYTGSAGWMYRVALESILGLRLSGGDILRIKPCIPDTWPGFSVTYRLTDGRTRYHITVRNPDRRARAVLVATCDAASLTVEKGMVALPLARDGIDHTVEVVLGDVD
ncbi:MAG: glycosyl transferase [Gammaproteobacteria bacterium]|nr:glycosyl transferase [Gammaproteobacteria bacterium]